MRLDDLRDRSIRIYWEDVEEGQDVKFLAEVEGYGILVQFEDMGDYQEIIPFKRIRGIGLLSD